MLWLHCVSARSWMKFPSTSDGVAGARSHLYFVFSEKEILFSHFSLFAHTHTPSLDRWWDESHVCPTKYVHETKKSAKKNGETKTWKLCVHLFGTFLLSPLWWKFSRGVCVCVRFLHNFRFLEFLRRGHESVARDTAARRQNEIKTFYYYIFVFIPMKLVRGSARLASCSTGGAMPRWDESILNTKKVSKNRFCFPVTCDVTWHNDNARHLYSVFCFCSWTLKREEGTVNGREDNGEEYCFCF